MRRVFFVLTIAAAIWYPYAWVSAQSTAFFPAAESYGGYGPTSAPRGFLGAPRVYVGVVEQSNGSVWSLQRQASTGTAAWPLRGYWLGASTDLALDGGIGLVISGSVFLPRNSSATWYSQPAAIAYDFDVPSYEWWSADALGKYPVTSGLDVLAGFRWDHTGTRVSYFDNTDDDYVLNAYIPLFGLQVTQKSSLGSLRIRATASPWLAGGLKYNFWTRTGYAEFGDFNASGGYFAELSADYSVKIRGDMGAGAFIKWSALHVNTVEQNLSGSNTEPISWSVDIRSWTFGASLAVGL